MRRGQSLSQYVDRKSTTDGTGTLEMAWVMGQSSVTGDLSETGTTLFNC